MINNAVIRSARCAIFGLVLFYASRIGGLHAQPARDGPVQLLGPVPIGTRLLRQYFKVINGTALFVLRDAVKIETRLASAIFHAELAA